MERYEKIKVLGKGSFGSAILIRRRTDGKHLVIKEVSMRQMSHKERLEARNECRVLQGLNHPNVVQYIEHFENRDFLYIVMEYADGGDLHTLITKRAKGQGGDARFGGVRKSGGSLLQEHEIMSYFAQICLAVDYLHTKYVLHRDIKSMNVFLTKSGQVKLGDFGISTILRNTVAVAQTVCGTPYYFSPELCRKRPYDNRSDIWALGVLLYECATGGKHPFDANNLEMLMRRIVNDKHPAISSKLYSKPFRDLLDSLLRKDPRKRPGIREVMSTPVVVESMRRLEGDVLLATKTRRCLGDILASNLKDPGQKSVPTTPRAQEGGEAQGPERRSTSSVPANPRRQDVPAPGPAPDPSAAASPTKRPNPFAIVPSKNMLLAPLAKETPAAFGAVPPKKMPMDRPSPGALAALDVANQFNLPGPAGKQRVNAEPLPPAEKGPRGVVKPLNLAELAHSPRISRPENFPSWQIPPIAQQQRADVEKTSHIPPLGGKVSSPAAAKPDMARMAMSPFLKMPQSPPAACKLPSPPSGRRLSEQRRDAPRGAASPLRVLESNSSPKWDAAAKDASPKPKREAQARLRELLNGMGKNGVWMQDDSNGAAATPVQSPLRHASPASAAPSRAAAAETPTKTPKTPRDRGNQSPRAAFPGRRRESSPAVVQKVRHDSRSKTPRRQGSCTPVATPSRYPTPRGKDGGAAKALNAPQLQAQPAQAQAARRPTNSKPSLNVDSPAAAGPKPAKKITQAKDELAPRTPMTPAVAADIADVKRLNDFQWSGDAQKDVFNLFGGGHPVPRDKVQRPEVAQPVPEHPAAPAVSPNDLLAAPSMCRPSREDIPAGVAQRRHLLEKLGLLDVLAPEADVAPAPVDEPEGKAELKPQPEQRAPPARQESNAKAQRAMAPAQQMGGIECRGHPAPVVGAAVAGAPADSPGSDPSEAAQRRENPSQAKAAPQRPSGADEPFVVKPSAARGKKQTDNRSAAGEAAAADGDWIQPQAHGINLVARTPQQRGVPTPLTPTPRHMLKRPTRFLHVSDLKSPPKDVKALERKLLSLRRHKFEKLGVLSTTASSSNVPLTFLSASRAGTAAAKRGRAKRKGGKSGVTTSAAPRKAAFGTPVARRALPRKKAVQRESRKERAIVPKLLRSTEAKADGASARRKPPLPSPSMKSEGKCDSEKSTGSGETPPKDVPFFIDLLGLPEVSSSDAVSHIKKPGQPAGATSPNSSSGLPSPGRGGAGVGPSSAVGQRSQLCPLGDRQTVGDGSFATTGAGTGDGDFSPAPGTRSSSLRWNLACQVSEERRRVSLSRGDPSGGAEDMASGVEQSSTSIGSRHYSFPFNFRAPSHNRRGDAGAGQRVFANMGREHHTREDEENLLLLLRDDPPKSLAGLGGRSGGDGAHASSQPQFVPGVTITSDRLTSSSPCPSTGRGDKEQPPAAMAHSPVRSRLRILRGLALGSMSSSDASSSDLRVAAVGRVAIPQVVETLKPTQSTSSMDTAEDDKEETRDTRACVGSPVPLRPSSASSPTVGGGASSRRLRSLIQGGSLQAPQSQCPDADAATDHLMSDQNELIGLFRRANSPQGEDNEGNAELSTCGDDSQSGPLGEEQADETGGFTDAEYKIMLAHIEAIYAPPRKVPPGSGADEERASSMGRDDRSSQADDFPTPKVLKATKALEMSKGSESDGSEGPDAFQDPAQSHSHYDEGEYDACESSLELEGSGDLDSYENDYLRGLPGPAQIRDQKEVL